jgi:predicted negative regulator of RcsB-dependent stress response
VARHSKKHAREVRRDRLREGALEKLELVGDRLEGRGRAILYGLGGLVLAGLLAFAYTLWAGKKENEARHAMGRAIEIASAKVGTDPAAPAAAASDLTFPTERERAERAADEFKKVADKYGEPYRSQANYFRASNLLSFDRPQGTSQLEALTKGSNDEVAAWAKFALAQARESDGQFDAAAALYKELASAGEPRTVPVDTANLRLAAVLEKQGKTSEAAEILFQIAKASREAKDKDGKPVAPSAAARAAVDKLETLDPARHAQLPPAPPANPLG